MSKQFDFINKVTDIQIVQKELEEKVWEASAGGGAVTVRVSGKKEIESVTLSPEVVDPEEVEDLQDLIMVCMNDILNQIEEANNEAVSSMTGGMNFGGLTF